MLSQLNLRFHKKLIEALKTRAGRENTSVNALAERFLDDGLKTVAPGDGYFQLMALLQIVGGDKLIIPFC
ncbi:transcriptional repressor pifC [Escherichia coli HVH 33 (4-2174936)]|nr:transcriptional repressor pifC [Escherichia coli HVH 33 (4-2174936)]